MNKNIEYKNDQLTNYLKKNRATWDQLYKSERLIINQLEFSQNSSILDIGCGCGSLGIVLQEKFGVRNYSGVEINTTNAECARNINSSAQIYCGDILELSKSILHGKEFDFVFSLSCIDWNVQFHDMLETAWTLVRPGGAFVVTFRLTTEVGCIDMLKSYQYINFEGHMEGEIANYVVLNVNDIFNEILAFNPLGISAYGYWGTPSDTAVTPYETLCFSAFSITKRKITEKSPVNLSLDFPKDISELIREFN